ncbi:CHAP domain-containing protein [Lacticaseibacillus paracasei]|uniref:CHAP domain-containing protein n=1 Tax=Lacticaseibacillus paracasei TaxID=1597 RepID=UPI000FF61888|nr:CHAP domain-containing protein [Lacticaseibacillus paracasei]QPC26363.1 CHAP domain-containing protein [Lacticaseibacillus paracasei subsp. tolerans]RNE41843.1 N-acetylmuramoyl-L-alanine amidase domain-containing protein precursor [Lacticaseibacillus paracasei]
MANNWKDMLLNKQHHDPKDALVSADPSRFKKALRGNKYRIQGVGGFGGKRFVRKKGQFRRGLLAQNDERKKKQASWVKRFRHHSRETLQHGAIETAKKSTVLAATNGQQNEEQNDPTYQTLSKTTQGGSRLKARLKRHRNRKGKRLTKNLGKSVKVSYSRKSIRKMMKKRALKGATISWRHPISSIRHLIKMLLSVPIIIKSASIMLLVGILFGLVTLIGSMFGWLVPTMSTTADSKPLTDAYSYITELDTNATKKVIDSMANTDGNGRSLIINGQEATTDGIELISDFDRELAYLSIKYDDFTVDDAFKQKIKKLHDQMMSVTVDAKTVTVNLSSFDEWEKNHPKALSQDDKDRLDAMGQVGQYRTQETLGSPFEDQNATIMANDRYAWRLRGGQKNMSNHIRISSESGKKIVAVMSGTVTAAANGSVTIATEGKRTVTGGLKTVTVKPTQKIKKGDQIGTSEKNITLQLVKITQQSASDESSSMPSSSSSSESVSQMPGLSSSSSSSTSSSTVAASSAPLPPVEEELNPAFALPNVKYTYATTYGLVTSGGNLTGQDFDANKFHAAWVKYFSNGVLADKESYSIDAAKKAGVNPALIAAIMGTESSWGTSAAIRGANNPSGQMSGGTIIAYPSLEAGIDATGTTLHNLVVTRGLNTVQKLGAAYAPVGAINDPNNLNLNWVPNVNKLLGIFGFKSGDSIGNITLHDGGNSYPAGQCTWWAKARSGWAANNWGNGADWGSSAAAAGFSVDHTPQQGALVSFAAGQMVGNWQADPVYGHVAYVEAVDADKGTITISQGGTGFKQQPGPNLQTLGNVGAYTYIHPR